MFRIRAPQDLGAAVIFFLVGAAGLYFGQRLPGMGASGQLGSGTMPRILSWICIGYGVVMLVKALRFDGPALATVPWRALGAVAVAVLAFGALVERVGYTPTAFLVPLLATFALRDIRWREALVVAVLLAACTSILFIALLGQPLRYVGSAN
jgi:Tripartite tricarboxylate transporter TctB family